MQAISLWQPWASLIACGAKPYETRSWAPPRALIGQPIAIHAAKKVDRGAAQFAEELMYGQHPVGGFGLADKLDASMSDAPDDLMARFGQALMPVGCVVAIATLDAAFLLGEPDSDAQPRAARIQRALTSRFVPDDERVPYDDFGDYSPGRWAWLLRDVRPLNPPSSARGAQGFFSLPQGWLVDA